MESKIVLITGGARSGKSTFAEQMVEAMGGQIGYIATSIPFDAGMRDRIKKHKEQRPDIWETFEKYKNLHELFDTNEMKDAYLLDCVTLLVTNLMFENSQNWDDIDYDQIDQIEARIQEQIDKMIKSIRKNGATVVMVTNEVGLGIVPENKLARVYRDIAGRVNQQIGHQADEVYLVVCGQPMKIK